MKHLVVLLLLQCCLFACEEVPEKSSINPVNWSKRSINYTLADSLTSGRSYLSVYSQIYSQTEHIRHNLTVTVSLRNVNPNDSIFIETATYYNTEGQAIRSYFDAPIYIAPLETVAIVIDQNDQDGGTGGNFLFDWKVGESAQEPLFEAVMLSTSGQQGISFTTQAKHLSIRKGKVSKVLEQSNR